MTFKKQRNAINGLNWKLKIENWKLKHQETNGNKWIKTWLGVRYKSLN